MHVFNRKFGLTFCEHITHYQHTVILSRYSDMEEFGSSGHAAAMIKKLYLRNFDLDSYLKTVGWPCGCTMKEINASSVAQGPSLCS